MGGEVLFQSFHGALLLAFLAQNAFRGVFALAGVVVHFHLHRADVQTFATMDARFLVAADAEQGEVAHGFEENGDGADVLAESSVVFEQHGEGDADRVIDQIADEEQHEQIVRGGLPEMEQQENER